MRRFFTTTVILLSINAFSQNALPTTTGLSSFQINKGLMKQTNIEQYSGSSQVLDSIYTWTWDNNSESWNYNQKTINVVYNANNDITSSFQQYFNGSSWGDHLLTTNTYDVNNNCVISIVQWASSLTKLYKYISTYDANHNKLTELIQTWSGTTWINALNSIRTFDANNNLTSRIEQIWNVGSNAFENTFKFDYTYDANNNCTKQLTQRPSFDANVWKIDSQILYTYNASNIITYEVGQSWEGSTWISTWKKLYTSDINNNITNYLFKKWSNNTWINFGLTNNTWNTNNILASTSYKTWNVNAAAYINQDSTHYYPHVIPVICLNPTDGGIIADNQSVCSGFSPAKLTCSTLPSGQSGSLEYKWQSSVSPFTVWIDIFSNTDTYSPDLITSTTRYRRVARVECMPDWTGAALSNEVTLTIKPVNPVSLNISANQNSICAGISVKFTAITTNGGETPAYQWKVNGSIVCTTPTYIYEPVQSDEVSCILTSNANCATGSPANSNAITMAVNSLPVASTGNNQATGPGAVDLVRITESIYYTTVLENASSYVWELTPTNAGSINGTGTEATVTWNTSYFGSAIIRVQAVNDCGASAWSEEKVTLVSNTTEVVENELCKLTVSPNPSDGKSVRIRFCHIIQRVEIVDVRGKVLYSKVVKADDCTLNPLLPKGIYLVRVFYANGHVNEKLVVD